MHVTFPTEQAAAAYQARIDDAYGHPKRGVHVGGGIHVDLNAPDRPGWTLHQHNVRKHPSRDEWAHPAIDPATLPGYEHMPPQAKVALEQAFAKAEQLGADWAPADIDAP